MTGEVIERFLGLNASKVLQETVFSLEKIIGVIVSSRSPALLDNRTES